MNIRKKSKKQEKNDADFFGGKCQPGSGACWGAKGDVKCENYLIENKYTDSDKYSFKLSLWDKLNNEAIKEGLRIPLFRVDIKDLKLVIWEESSNLHTLQIWWSANIKAKSYTLSYSFIKEIIENANSSGKIFVGELVFCHRKFILMLREDFKDFVDDCLEV